MDIEFIKKSTLGHLIDVIKTQFAKKDDVEEQIGQLSDEVLRKVEQELTSEEQAQVRKNLRFIGKDVEGEKFTIDGVEITASQNAEIFGDYDSNIAVGQWSIAEGSGTVAKGSASHAEGAMTQALADGTHTEGYSTKATGYWSHAEGEMTVVSSYASHAEGSYCTMPDGSKRYTTAAGYASHSEGGGCYTTGSCAHAEGLASTASGGQSHVEGKYTIAAGSAQHVEGVANIEDTANKYIHIAGNGTQPADRSNAYTLDRDGNAWYSGDVYVGSTSGTNKDDGSKKLATEEYVDTSVAAINPVFTITIGKDYVPDKTFEEAVAAHDNKQTLQVIWNNGICIAPLTLYAPDDGYMIFSSFSYEADEDQFAWAEGESVVFNSDNTVKISTANLLTETSSDLETSSQDVIGAINEVNSKVNDLGENVLEKVEELIEQKVQEAFAALPKAEEAEF